MNSKALQITTFQYYKNNDRLSSSILRMLAVVVLGIIGFSVTYEHISIERPALGLSVTSLGALEMLGSGDSAAGYQFTIAAFSVAGLLIIHFGLLKLGKSGDFFSAFAVHWILNSTDINTRAG